MQFPLQLLSRNSDESNASHASLLTIIAEVNNNYPGVSMLGYDAHLYSGGIPLLAEEGWMRRAKRGADGVVRPAKRFGRTDHPGASRHPSSARRGIPPLTNRFFRSLPDVDTARRAWEC